MRRCEQWQDSMQRAMGLSLCSKKNANDIKQCRQNFLKIIYKRPFGSMDGWMDGYESYTNMDKQCPWPISAYPPEKKLRLS